LGSDRSRGYCLEMIGADFLAVANLDNGNPDIESSPNFVADCHDSERRKYRMVDEMLLLGVAIFCADFAFQSPVTTFYTHRAALIFSHLA